MIQKVVLSNDEVDQIKSLPNYWREHMGEDDVWFDSKLHSQEDGYFNPKVRKSLEFTVSNKVIEPILLPHLTEYQVKSITGQVIMLQYNKGHYFKRHRDRIIQNPLKSRRLQTVIVQLSDEDDYEGGDLVVRNEIASKTKGNLIIFDSNELHECKMITGGTRYCLVTWLSSDDYGKRGLM